MEIACFVLSGFALLVAIEAFATARKTQKETSAIWCAQLIGAAGVGKEIFDQPQFKNLISAWYDRKISDEDFVSALKEAKNAAQSETQTETASVNI